MKFSVQREVLLAPLQQVVGAVERKQTSPILGNVLLKGEDDYLTAVATDSEIEIQARVSLDIDTPGATTVSARKLLDICRLLPESGKLDFQLAGDKVTLKSGRSRFSLATLPANDFPALDALDSPQHLSVPAELLHNSIRATAFSMAQQDVRFYLNGMLLEIGSERLACIATDGHRLAYSQCETEVEPEIPVRAIVPRKGVNELLRLLGTLDNDTAVEMQVTGQRLQIDANGIQLSTKLIDGRFPDYNRVIPIDGNKELVVDSKSFKECLTRASVLSNEKYRGVRIALNSGLLTISSNNPEQEEAFDELEVDYAGESTEIGFNVAYLLDVLSVLDCELIRIILKDGGSSALITPVQESGADSKYVVMPMRL